MNRSSPFLLLALLVLVAACGGPSATPSPLPSPSPSPSVTPPPSVAPTASPSPATPPPGSPTPISSPAPTTGSIAVTSHAQAAALVLASDARFTGIGPQQFDMIGQCCWYEVAEAVDGWEVTVTIGSGDCMAGCIDRQTWRYHVDGTGNIELLAEEGSAEPRAPTGSGPATATVQVVGGPTCPVISDPPDPACELQPVVGAEIVVRAPDGTELARGVTDQQGRFPMTAEPGTYWLEPQPVEGLLGTASGIAFRLAPGEQAVYTLYYDTGIR